MSNVSGSIAVNVEFRDSTTSSGVQSLKTIALRDTTEYTTGKVAIITGTAGTATTGITFSNVYRNASGALVSFLTFDRICFSWSGTASRSLRALGGEDESETTMLLNSKNNQAAASALGDTDSLQITSGTGTGTYTVVLYGT